VPPGGGPAQYFVSDFNRDGDPDEIGVYASGDSDDVTPDQIKAMYPPPGNAPSDLGYAFMNVYLREKGYQTFNERTENEIGRPGSLWTNGDPASAGPTTLAQWYLGEYNNHSYPDVWKWAVGAVARDWGSYTFLHPKDPVGLGSSWAATRADVPTASFGSGAMYRGLTAYASSTAECGSCVNQEVLIGYLNEGSTWADAYWRAKMESAYAVGFGDPLYRPFSPGKVAEHDTTPPRSRRSASSIKPFSPGIERSASSGRSMRRRARQIWPSPRSSMAIRALWAKRSRRRTRLGKFITCRGSSP
jgi:hypothetical protein